MKLHSEYARSEFSAKKEVISNSQFSLNPNENFNALKSNLSYNDSQEYPSPFSVIKNHQFHNVEDIYKESELYSQEPPIESFHKREDQMPPKIYLIDENLNRNTKYSPNKAKHEASNNESPTSNIMKIEPDNVESEIIDNHTKKSKKVEKPPKGHPERGKNHKEEMSPNIGFDSQSDKYSPSNYTREVRISPNSKRTNNSSGSYAIKPTKIHSEERPISLRAGKSRNFDEKPKHNKKDANNCIEDGYNEIRYDNGAIYKGNFHNEMRTGFGKQSWPDGSNYSGHFLDDRIEGNGSLVYPNQDVYTGEWKNNMANGLGEFKSNTGAYYKGNWIDDNMFGQGQETNENGDTYEGNYENGKKSGYGVYNWIDGSFYKGHWKNNKFNGSGNMQWSDGRNYQGTWMNNKMHGKGMFIWPDKSKYEGEYVADKRHGEGKMTFSDGKCYVGPWKSGQSHGNGILILTNGKQREGNWIHGR